MISSAIYMELKISTLPSLINGQGTATSIKLGPTLTPTHSFQLEYLMRQVIPVWSLLLQATSQEKLLQWHQRVSEFEVSLL